MSAKVIPFKARTAPSPDCTCPRHQLDALAARFEQALDKSDGELLIAREYFVEAWKDLRRTTDRLLPPTDERGTR